MAASDHHPAHRQMNMALNNYDGKMIPRNKCGLNSLTFILQLRKKQEIDPTGIKSRHAGREATTLPPEHSGGQVCLEINIKEWGKFQLLGIVNINYSVSHICT